MSSVNKWRCLFFVCRQRRKYMTMAVESFAILFHICALVFLCADYFNNLRKHGSLYNETGAIMQSMLFLLVLHTFCVRWFSRSSVHWKLHGKIVVYDKVTLKFSQNHFVPRQFFVFFDVPSLTTASIFIVSWFCLHIFYIIQKKFIHFFSPLHRILIYSLHNVAGVVVGCKIIDWFIKIMG